MYGKIYRLEGAHVRLAETFVRMYYQQAYESVYPNGFIRLYEENSLVLEEHIMVCIRVDATEASNGKMIIEFITNYGNMFSFFKSEDNRDSYTMKRFTEKLEEFCKENSISLDIHGRK